MDEIELLHVIATRLQAQPHPKIKAVSVDSDFTGGELIIDTVDGYTLILRSRAIECQETEEDEVIS